MIDYIKGNLVQKHPTYVIIECGGIGYHVNISLLTYEKLIDQKECKLHTHLVIKEDAHILYGFFEESEKQLFQHLISVSGIGPNLGRMILSSFPPKDLKKAITSGDIALIKSIKGIGSKSGQRLIVELQDTLKKEEGLEGKAFMEQPDGDVMNEARQALGMLGFNKGEAEKALRKVVKQNEQGLNAEKLIKLALKNL